MCVVGGIVSGPRIYESLMRYAERDAFVAAARAPSGTWGRLSSTPHDSPRVRQRQAPRFKAYALASAENLRTTAAGIAVVRFFKKM